MKFDNDFARMRRNHDRFQIFVIGFIAVIFVAIICWFIFLGVVLYKTSGTVEKVGVSGAVEKIWCGERTDCKLPEFLK